MYQETTFQQLAEQALALCRGFDAEIMLSSTDSALTRFSENIITQNVSKSDVGISVRLLKDGRMGKAATGNLVDDGIEKCVNTAKMALKVAEPDDEIQPLVGKQDYLAKSGTYFQDTHELSPEARADGVSLAVTACQAENLDAAGIYSNTGTSFALANSAGLWAFHESSRATFSLSAMSKDSSGWADDSDARAKNLALDRVITKAIRVANQGRKPASIEPGAYTVVFEPAAVADFLLFLGWVALNGLSFVEGRSCFAGQVGQKVVGENITLLDDFTHPLTPGRPFDFEGSPRQKVTIIDQGIFRSTVHDRKTAKLAGVKPTGHGMPQPDSNGPAPLNLVLMPGDSSLEEMIASTENGLLVTRLHYTNILNPMTMSLTGMTRDGLFQIEHGEVTKGLKNMRFTDSVLQVLSNVVALSSQQYKTETFWGGGGTVAPAMKVNNFHFTSKTEN